MSEIERLKKEVEFLHKALQQAQTKLADASKSLQEIKDMAYKRCTPVIMPDGRSLGHTAG